MSTDINDQAAMVSNATLATICVLTGLYEHLQFASSDLANQITLYVAKIRALCDEELSTAAKEQRLPRQFWVEIEPPKVNQTSLRSLSQKTRLSSRIRYSRLYRTLSSPLWLPYT